MTTTVEFVAKPGEMNKVDVHSSFAGRVIDVYDAWAKITTISGSSAITAIPSETDQSFPCDIVDDYHARCVTTDAVRSVDVDLGDRNDKFMPSPLTANFTALVHGGPGDDYIELGPNEAGAPPAAAYGDDGSNVLVSTSTNMSRQIGGAQQNWLIGGPEHDLISAANGVGDYIACAGGDDQALADDRIDAVGPDCETVTTR